MNKWFAALVNRGHQGAGKGLDEKVYVYTDDLVRASEIASRLPAYKHGDLFETKQLSDEQSAELEKLISETQTETLITLDRAREQGIFHRKNWDRDERFTNLNDGLSELEAKWNRPGGERKEK